MLISNRARTLQRVSRPQRAPRRRAQNQKSRNQKGQSRPIHPRPVKWLRFANRPQHRSSQQCPDWISGTPEIGFVSQNDPPTSRAAINRANAQLSTGPRSSAGKQASSRNATKHGLASGQLIIPGEDPAAFGALLADLLSDHQPADSTEELLVNAMAQSYWLSQRALRLQNDCFTENGVDQKSLALFLRYGATHHRAFYKALADLHRLQKERKKQERGFVSQSAAKPPAAIGVVSQYEPLTGPTLGFVSPTAPVNSTERRNNTAQAA